MKNYLHRLVHWIPQVVSLLLDPAPEQSWLAITFSSLSWRQRHRAYRAGCLLAVVWVGLAGQAGAQTISTVAGSSLKGDGGLAVNANVSYPNSVAVDGTGNLYIADTYNHRIRKVSTTGIISTVAGNETFGFSGDGGAATTASLNNPSGVAVDESGNLYIADTYNNRIRKVDAKGIISTVAGNGTSSFAGDGEPATVASLYHPFDVTVDKSGNLYIADESNHRIRKIDVKGIISTVAGNGTGGFSGDGGAATAASLKNPNGITVDGSGNLYIADYNNYRVRKVSTGGIISTVAGNGTQGFGGDGAAATLAKLNLPTDVAVDSSGNLYIVDYTNQRIRKVDMGGIISTVAGIGTFGFSGDGGLATAARLGNPHGMAIDGLSNLYIADAFNNRIRKVSAQGMISTVAGNGALSFFGDGGAAMVASLNNPFDVAVDSSGNLYIADTNNYRIRKVSAGGIISTVAGNGNKGFNGDGGPATEASLDAPYSIVVDRLGNVYFADPNNQRIRKVSAAGIISTVAGNGTNGFDGDGGLATAASLNYPHGVTVDGLGNLYFADTYNNRIRKISAAGIISTVAGDGGFGFRGDGGAATEARLNNPDNVAVDGSGNLYIADRSNYRIRKVSAGGTISTVAGNGTNSFSGDGGPATAASLPNPYDVAVDRLGNLYVADAANHRIRKVSVGGIISTVAGNGTYGFSGDGGPATTASLNEPNGVAVDSSGTLYIADLNNNRIRKVTQNTAPTVIRAVAPQSVTVGVAYSLSLASTFTDAETPNALTLTVAGLPASLSLNGTIIAGTLSTPVGSPYSVTVTATDPGSLSASTTFTITVISSVTGTPTGTFAITGVTTISCTAGASDQRSLTFSPQYNGLNGTPVSFQVVNQLVATTTPGPYTLSLSTTNPVLTLRAMQDGVTSNFSYNWLVACTNSIPLGVEPVIPLYVKVMGNPVRETVDVEVSGSVGGSLDLLLTDLQGRVVRHHTLRPVASVERVRFGVSGLPAGVFLLQVTTPSQSERIRILKKE